MNRSIPWIGIDGEGLGRDPHRYVMLCASDRRKTISLSVSANGLSTIQCLDFILSLPKRARIAGYFFGYDWTMILRDLPNGLIYKLLRPELRTNDRGEGARFLSVRWRGYRLHYMAGAMTIGKGSNTRTVWDVGSYFQCAFVKALERWNIAPEVRADIAVMKDKRSSFAAHDIPSIRVYCERECRALAELMTALEAAHDDLGVRPRSWYGPGSTASAVLSDWDIETHKGDPPSLIVELADRAFFGGRFENAGIGTFDDMTGYDIVSAYPHQTLHLPCLAHGTWTHTRDSRRLPRKVTRTKHALVSYTVHDIGPHIWGPLPCRLNDGNILFPQAGFSGYVWLDEYLAAREYWRGIEFREAWIYETKCDCHPFAGVSELFAERLRVGKTSKGHALKLIINSLYGKLAQRIGTPRFASPIWAGMITSGTRAAILRAIARDESAILAVATDGIYSRRTLSLSEAPTSNSPLGSWEAERHGTMTFARPGVYWTHNDATIRARGLGRKQLEAHRDSVLEAIHHNQTRVHLGYSEAFGGAKACVYRMPSGEIRRSNRYGTWHLIPARISLEAGPKRASNFRLFALDGVESMPYSEDTISGKNERKREAIAWGSL